MEHTRFGRTGLQVSKLCLGTMVFGAQCDEAQAHTVLDAAAEGGIDFLDTADVYPMGGGPATAGRTEEIVGAWLKGKRHRFILATKCAGNVGSQPWDQGMSRKHILDAIDASLRRFGTDCVDLYQLHRYDPQTPLDEALEALDSVLRQGKARYIGVSNWPAYRIARGLGRSEVRNLVRIELGAAALQPAVPRLRARPAAALRRRGHRGHSLQPVGGRIPHRQARPQRAADRRHPVFARQWRAPLPRALLVTSGSFWAIVAIPDIRQQAMNLAEYLGSQAH